MNIRLHGLLQIFFPSLPSVSKHIGITLQSILIRIKSRNVLLTFVTHHLVMRIYVIVIIYQIIVIGSFISCVNN